MRIKNCLLKFLKLVLQAQILLKGRIGGAFFYELNTGMCYVTHVYSWLTSEIGNLKLRKRGEKLFKHRLGILDTNLRSTREWVLWHPKL